jgi:hypothetical protein
VSPSAGIEVTPEILDSSERYSHPVHSCSGRSVPDRLGLHGSDEGFCSVTQSSIALNKVEGKHAAVALLSIDNPESREPPPHQR